MSLWSCSSCSKSFARKGDLTRHELLHTGVKPHVCETCGKGFAQFSGLKTHRNIHSKAKPYLCGIGTCMKTFGDPSSCTRHRKETHRREGAYKCIVDDCGTRIKRRSAFVAHLKKHGIDPNLLDLDAIASQSRGRSSPVHFMPPYVANEPQHVAKTQTASPSVCSDNFASPQSQCPSLAKHSGSETSDVGSISDCPFSSQESGLYIDPPAVYHSSPYVPRCPSLDGVVSVLPAIPLYDMFSDAYGDYCNAFDSNDAFSGSFDYSLFGGSPLHIPVPETFADTGSNCSRSLSSSPLSFCGSMYSPDSLDNIGLASLPSNVSQDFLLFSTT